MEFEKCDFFDRDNFDPAAPRYLMRRLWRLFQRARLDRTEVNILRGFLKAVLLAARRGEGE